MCSPQSHVQTSHTAEASLSVCTKCPPQTPPPTCVSLVFRVDFLIEEVLCQQIEFSVLFPDSMRSDELELLQSKLIELVLHLPKGRLLQLGDRLLCGWLLFARLPQVGFLPYDERTTELKPIQIHVE